MLDTLLSIDDALNLLKDNDCEEYRKRLLTSDAIRFRYCHEINDLEEVWCQITEGYWAYCYCVYVKDRPEVKAKIKHPMLMFSRQIALKGTGND